MFEEKVTYLGVGVSVYLHLVFLCSSLENTNETPNKTRI